MSDEEMVAWVDEDEKVIKPIPISLANSDPLYLHSEVAILLYDNRRRLLLTKRSMTKNVLPGIWMCSAAGHITYGESIEQAAHRELLEETGLNLNKLVEVDRIINKLPNERHYSHWFFGKYTGGAITLQTHESDSYKWFTQQEFVSFNKTHNVGTKTQEVATRFWSGEWDHLLK